MTGAHTVSLIGKYDTIEEAIVDWNQATTTTLTDSVNLYIAPGVGPGRYNLVKVTVAA